MNETITVEELKSLVASIEDGISADIWIEPESLPIGQSDIFDNLLVALEKTQNVLTLLSLGLLSIDGASQEVELATKIREICQANLSGYDEPAPLANDANQHDKDLIKYGKSLVYRYINDLVSVKFH